MRAMRATKNAWKIYKGRFGEMMMFILLETVLRLMVLTPLLFFTCPQIRPLALLCVPLFVLIVLPARQNAAEVMQEAIRGGSMFSARLVLGKGYWRKVGAGLRQTAVNLIWALPLITLAIYGYSLWTSETVDGLTLVRMIGQLDLVKHNFFDGAIVLAGIVLALVLLVTLGMGVHSGRRHERALGKGRLLRGHRGGVMGVWLMSLLLLLPFLALTAGLGMEYVLRLVEWVKSFMSGPFPVFDLTRVALLGGGFVLLLLPLVPLKSLMSACYVHDLWEGGK